jgi:hypothetical protein
MEACVNDHPTSARPPTSKSKRKRNLEKKLHKRARVVKEAATKVPKKNEGRATHGGENKQATHGMPCNPETRGRKAAEGERSRDNQPATPLPT